MILVMILGIIILVTSLVRACSDSEHGDTHAAGGGLQHRSVAEKPREEPLHGRVASGPLPAVPHHHRRRELQLHQRCADGRMSHTHTQIHTVSQLSITSHDLLSRWNLMVMATPQSVVCLMCVSLASYWIASSFGFVP